MTTNTNTRTGIAPVALVIIALLVLGGGGYALKKGIDKGKSEKARENKEEAAAMKTETLVIELAEQNASGQAGQAVITEVGTAVKVVVNLTGKPSDVVQPAHIHLGSCPTPGAVKYPLTSIGSGAAQTEIPGTTIAQLLSELPLAINVHKSAAEVSVYVACGDIMEKENGGVSAETSSNSAAAESGNEAMGTETGKEIKVIYNTQGFSPKTITIKKGETVVFENKTGKAASVASDEHPTHLLYPEFDQYKTAARGKNEFRFTFTEVGIWNYHDHLNANMVGTVVVE